MGEGEDGSGSGEYAESGREGTVRCRPRARVLRRVSRGGPSPRAVAASLNAHCPQGLRRQDCLTCRRKGGGRKQGEEYVS